MDSTDLIVLNVAAKSAVILLTGFAVCACFRKAPASIRSLIWLVAFVLLAALPLTVAVRPAWRWSVPLVVKTTLDATGSELAGGQQTGLPLNPDYALPTRADFAVSSKENPWWLRWNARECLVAIYLIVAGLLLLRRLAGSVQLRFVVTGKAGLRFQPIVDDLMRRHRLRRRVKVRCSSQIPVPMTWGVVRPVIAMPDCAASWNDEAVQAAVRHEFAHVLHGDAAKRWLATLALALFWPNPLVWFAARAWKHEQERACDDFVLVAGTNAEAYAWQLIEAAKAFRGFGFQMASALVMAMPSGLEERLQSVMDAGRKRESPGRGASLVSLLAGAGLMAGCAAFHAQMDGAASEQKQILVQARFIEVRGLENQELLSLSALKKTLQGQGVSLSEAETQSLLRQLSQRKGVDLMSAPSVTTRSGQKATVEVVREFIYPTEFERKEAALSPTAFEMKPIGVMLEAEPILRADGTVRLRGVTARVNEFDGFVTGGVENLVPDQKGGWKLDERKTLEGEMKTVPQGQAAIRASGRLTESIDASIKHRGTKSDQVSLPLFTTIEWSGNLVLTPGEWHLRHLKQTSGDRELHANQHVWCLVHARGVEVPKKAPVKAAASVGTDTVKIDSKFLSIADDAVLLRALNIDSIPDQPAAALLGVFSKAQAEKLDGALACAKGTNVLAAPRLRTRPNEKATIEMGREMPYPTAFAADGKTVTESARRKVGLTLEATPDIGGEGATISLDVAIDMTDFLGWRLLDREALLAEEPKGGGPYQPVFTTTKLNTGVAVWPEQTVVVSMGRDSKGRRRICLLTNAIEHAAAAGGSFTVFGGVARQGKYEFQSGMTVADALRMAGNVVATAPDQPIKIERGVPPNRRALIVDRAQAGSTALAPGDAIVVPVE